MKGKTGMKSGGRAAQNGMGTPGGTAMKRGGTAGCYARGGAVKAHLGKKGLKMTETALHGPGAPSATAASGPVGKTRFASGGAVSKTSMANKISPPIGKGEDKQAGEND